MSQFKQEDVKGLVRNKDSTHTAVLKDGTRKTLDACETSSLMNRLDKDRSRMEREGTREIDRGPERRQTAGEARERQERMRQDMARRQKGDRR